jgi:hypothetical protein
MAGGSAREIAMAKGQKRSNRETRKPKTATAKTATAKTKPATPTRELPIPLKKKK